MVLGAELRRVTRTQTRHEPWCNTRAEQCLGRASVPTVQRATSRHLPHLARLVGRARFLTGLWCGLIEQSIKWVHKSDGTKRRQMISPDAGCTVPAPTLFALTDINAAETQAEKETQLHLKEHPDRKGADIGGARYALDRAMLMSVTQSSRAGGMATKGTAADPHLMCVTGDGAGLTGAESGVRVAHFPGSTNLLAQSSNDVINWVFYKERCKAEDYTVLDGRLANLLPDIRRLYANGHSGQLCPDGNPSGIYIKLVLVADKPFIRHVCGLLSHNADAFGAPMCTCCDTSYLRGVRRGRGRRDGERHRQEQEQPLRLHHGQAQACRQHIVRGPVLPGARRTLGCLERARAREVEVCLPLLPRGATRPHSSETCVQ